MKVFDQYTVPEFMLDAVTADTVLSKLGKTAYTYLMSQVSGVDIGVGSIKIVALDTSGDKPTLVSVGEIKNPSPDWVSGDNKKSVEEVAKAIKSLWSDLKIGRKAR